MSVDQAAEIEALPLLNDLLPYEIEEGSWIECMKIACAKCGTDIYEDIRGTVGPGLTPDVAVVKAFAVCYECKTITPVEGRFNSDGSAFMKSGDGWIQTEWSFKDRFNPSHKSPPLWQKVIPPAVAVAIFAGWIALR